MTLNRRSTRMGPLIDDPLTFPVQMNDFRDRRCLISLEKRLTLGDVFERDEKKFEIVRLTRINIADARTYFSQLGFYLPGPFIKAFEKRYGEWGPNKLVWIYFYKPIFPEAASREGR
jgi:hypothetical protein